MNESKRQCVGRSRGAASVELAAVAPMAALFIVLAFQLASLFSDSVRAVADAEALAARSVRRWDAESRGAGFDRPCLEMMEQTVFAAGGEPHPIGVGPFRRYVAVPQEVRVVAGPICIP